MNAGLYNFSIEQGADFDLSISWATRTDGVDTLVDITGYNARWQFITDKGEIIEWLSTGVSPVITVDAINKKFIIAVPAVITATYNFVTANHEFEVTAPSGKKYRFLKGYCKLETELKV